MPLSSALSTPLAARTIELVSEGQVRGAVVLVDPPSLVSELDPTREVAVQTGKMDPAKAGGGVQGGTASTEVVSFFLSQPPRRDVVVQVAVTPWSGAQAALCPFFALPSASASISGLTPAQASAQPSSFLLPGSDAAINAGSAFPTNRTFLVLAPPGCYTLTLSVQSQATPPSRPDSYASTSTTVYVTSSRAALPVALQRAAIASARVSDSGLGVDVLFSSFTNMGLHRNWTQLSSASTPSTSSVGALTLAYRPHGWFDCALFLTVALATAPVLPAAVNYTCTWRTRRHLFLTLSIPTLASPNLDPNPSDPSGAAALLYSSLLPAAGDALRLRAIAADWAGARAATPSAPVCACPLSRAPRDCQCYPSSPPSSSPSPPPPSVTILPAYAAPTVRVVLVVSRAGGVCRAGSTYAADDIVIDATRSEGRGGRPWAPACGAHIDASGVCSSSACPSGVCTWTVTPLATVPAGPATKGTTFRPENTAKQLQSYLRQYVTDTARVAVVNLLSVFGSNPSSLYPGTYIVTLALANAYGAVGAGSAEIVITAPPVASPTPAPTLFVVSGATTTLSPPLLLLSLPPSPAPRHLPVYVTALANSSRCEIGSNSRQLRYQWQLYLGLQALPPAQWLGTGGLGKTSAAPAGVVDSASPTLVLPPYTLQAGLTYRLVCTVFR